MKTILLFGKIITATIIGTTLLIAPTANAQSDLDRVFPSPTNQAFLSIFKAKDSINAGNYTKAISELKRAYTKLTSETSSNNSAGYIPVGQYNANGLVENTVPISEFSQYIKMSISALQAGNQNQASDKLNEALSRLNITL